MKIAFAASGEGLTAPLDSRFGRARGFVVVDSDTKGITYIDNRANVAAGHGAGTGAAQLVAGAGAEVVVAPEVGPKAEAVLESAGVKFVVGTAGRSIEEIFEEMRGGALS